MLPSVKKNEGLFAKIYWMSERKRSQQVKFTTSSEQQIQRELFAKGYTNKWSYKLYEVLETVNDTIPSYRIDILPERFIEALLEKRTLKLKENDSIMKKLIIN